MKHCIKFFILTLFMGLSLQAQEDLNSNYSSEVFKSEQDGLSLLSNFSKNVELNSLNENRTATYNVNAVIIQQVGFNNNVNSITNSQSSTIEYSQIGDNNNIDMSISAPHIDASIFQNGNNNSVIDNIYYTNSNVELNLVQDGNNLSVNRIGTNSLTEKLQLVQKGQNKTITIISN